MPTQPLRLPQPFETGRLDPAVERAWYLSELDQLELTRVIPKAEPDAPRL